MPQLACECDPSLALYHFNYAVWFESQRMFEMAEARYKTAIQKDAFHLPSLCNLAVLLAQVRWRSLPEVLTREGTGRHAAGNRGLSVRGRDSGNGDPLAGAPCAWIQKIPICS